MFYAITPRGAGFPVGMRTVASAATPLAQGETFIATNWAINMVLAEDGVSLRAATAKELTEMARHGPTRIMLDQAGILYIPPPPKTADEKLNDLGLTKAELKDLVK